MLVTGGTSPVGCSEGCRLGVRDLTSVDVVGIAQVRDVLGAGSVPAVAALRGGHELARRLPALAALKATRGSPRPDHEMVRCYSNVGVGDLEQFQLEAMRLGHALGVRYLNSAAREFRLSKPAARVVLRGVVRG